LIYCDSAAKIDGIGLRTMALIQEAFDPSESFIVKIERNSCDTNGRVTKDCTPADIPTVVGLSDQGIWAKQTRPSPRRYRIVSASIHTGTIEYGHYVTVVYKGGG
jgi:ubiquitin C-terminal hydrolase